MFLLTYLVTYLLTYALTQIECIDLLNISNTKLRYANILRVKTMNIYESLQLYKPISNKLYISAFIFVIVTIILPCGGLNFL